MDELGYIDITLKDYPIYKRCTDVMVLNPKTGKWRNINFLSKVLLKSFKHKVRVPIQKDPFSLEAEKVLGKYKTIKDFPEVQQFVDTVFFPTIPRSATIVPPIPVDNVLGDFEDYGDDLLPPE